MELKDIMSAQFAPVPVTATVQAAAKLMKNQDVSLLPVTEKGRLCGMITDRDIVVRSVADGNDPMNTAVGRVMTADVAYVYEHDDVAKAVDIMKELQIRHLIVTSRDDQPVGVITLGDLAAMSGDADLAGEVLMAASGK